LHAPDTVVALPADPPERLEGAIEGIREVAARCYERERPAAAPAGST
jgi:hypothetical protein